MAWYYGRPMLSLCSSLPSAPTHSCHGVCPCHIWRLSYSMTAGWGPLSSRCLSHMWQHPERQTGGGAILCVALPSQLESTCVVDPDPDPSSLMFSGSGSFHQQAKKSKKNLDFYYFVTLFLSFDLWRMILLLRSGVRMPIRVVVLAFDLSVLYYRSPCNLTFPNRWKDKPKLSVLIICDF